MRRGHEAQADMLQELQEELRTLRSGNVDAAATRGGGAAVAASQGWEKHTNTKEYVAKTPSGCKKCVTYCRETLKSFV